ncbi:protein SOSEKI 5 isoform X1 [Gastrolobium bilobum]|uniref:protein SOSEKI 5 isoform X1 n=1 Tax=Gastrolobium bilobum TaxID=150636 RepID=UPI002AB0AEEC|nr:protein SOSEKI 5 isoform X1 [Gastrolobium bilobum]
MSVTSSSRRRVTELQIPNKWTDRETSPERTKVWTEPKPKTPRKVSVVYYLSRNGQLEHPHFIEVPLSSPHGLYLKDVINRLNLLRGNGMANMYSWSAKRSYKKGFVWHDLSENDFIYPTQGQDYILKGSEILDHATITPRPSETHKPEDESDFPAVITRRRNQSWSSIDLNEYRVYKSESLGDSAGKIAADASTQTDDYRRRRRTAMRDEEEKNGIEEVEMEGERVAHVTCHNNHSTELSRDEISPPPSDSSPETLETLMKADGRLGLRSSEPAKENDLMADSYPSGRMRASSVLLQLLSCGAVSFKESEANSVKDQGFSLVGHYKSRLPRGAGNHEGKEVGTSMEIPDLSRVRLEDKEYFSGSLIETKKTEAPAFKRSSSYNADSGSRLQIIEHEGDVVRSKCIPRKPKPTKKEEGGSMHIVNSGQQGSKRFDLQQ